MKEAYNVELGGNRMKITIIHGQMHKGVTYTMTKTLCDNLRKEGDETKEFFLPKDGPEFCHGCNQCFLKGEEFCPSADKMQPIVQAIEWADVLILDSPNYVMEMNGAMKNLFDHLAYRWVTHRPTTSMFHKIGITISSSAGAPANHTVRSMAKQLKWMCCPKVYTFPFICNALGPSELKEEKKRKMIHKAEKIAKAVRKRVGKQNASLRGKLFFQLFRKMQLSPDASWNPTDRDWWVNQGWTKNVRPWKKGN